MENWPRMTPATTAVLNSLVGEGDAWTYGYDLLSKSGLRSGSLYPILLRLAARGFLEARWEEPMPQGRPPRHLYRLTPAGRELASRRKTVSAVRARPSGRLRLGEV